MQSMEKIVSIFFFFLMNKAKAVTVSLQLCYPAVLCFKIVEMESNS